MHSLRRTWQSNHRFFSGAAMRLAFAVPADLRPHVGHREFTRSLGATDKGHAVSLALAMAAKAKTLFCDLRRAMNEKDIEAMKRLLQHARKEHFLRERIDDLENALADMRSRHLKELNDAVKEATLKARADALIEAMKARGVPIPPSAMPAAKEDESPKLGKVVKDYLDNYRQDKKAAMFMKHKTVLPLFVQIVGDKKVSQLKQADINKFFEIVQKLPPRWSDEVRKRGVSVLALAGKAHEKTMGPKTIEDTYKTCIRAFLLSAKRDLQDEGFPTTLTTDGIEYTGERRHGERQQRAFRSEELRRLFEGPEMKALGEDPHSAMMFWLPHIGLFTGARVNEICQLNPQTDIVQADGIWHFRFTEETEAEEGVKKSIKNKSSDRRVPIHSQLMAIGFLDYVTAIRKTGAKQLFPDWPAERGKASPKAEKWFRKFLMQLSLRDETPGAQLVGMHAFRHNLLARAKHLRVDGAIEITGHVGSENAVVRGYEGELALDRKQEILERITFDVRLHKPITPAPLMTRGRGPRESRK